MFGAETVAFLESGCGIVVATADADAHPTAARGWAISVVAADEGKIRVLVDADDETVVAQLGAGSLVAVTAADVRTYYALQLKGRAAGLDPATAVDVARAEEHVAALHVGVLETDGTPWELFQRFIPSRYVACTVVVDELYDQTPGPAAGASLGGSAP